MLYPSAMPDTPLEAARYLPQMPCTAPGAALQRLFAMTPKESDPLQQALAFMHTVRAEVAYVPGSTTNDTTAEQAAAQGCGVCQDHSQILLSLLRMAGIPCRYVAGFLLGEGRTHAWTEAYVSGAWVGLDATNGMVVQDTHIAIAIGRDHTDCELNRGVMLGGDGQLQQIQVAVRERPVSEK